MNLIFDKKAFLAYKEKINKEKYIKPGITAKADNVEEHKKLKEELSAEKVGEDKITKGETEKLGFPKANTEELLHKASMEDSIKNYVNSIVDKLMKEGHSQSQALEIAKLELKSRGYDDSDIEKYMGKVVSSAKMTEEAQEWISNKIRTLVEEGYDQEQAIAIAYSMAREKGYDVPEKKEASIKGDENIQEGAKEKLDYPTSQDAFDPSIKLPYMKEEKVMKKPAPVEKINIEKSQADLPKADLKVSVEKGDTNISEHEKGQFKSINPNPDIELAKEKADKQFSDYEKVPKMMKQFNIKFYKKQDPFLYKGAMLTSINKAIENVEMLSLAYGKDIFNTPFAPIYAALLVSKDINNMLIKTAGKKKTVLAILKEIKDKYVMENKFNKEKMIEDFKPLLGDIAMRLADWLEKYDFKESVEDEEKGKKDFDKAEMKKGEEKGFGKAEIGKEKGEEKEKSFLEKISKILWFC